MIYKYTKDKPEYQVKDSKIYILRERGIFMKKKCYPKRKESVLAKRIIIASLVGAVVFTSSGAGKLVALAGEQAEEVVLDETPAAETAAESAVGEETVQNKTARAAQAGDTFKQLEEYDAFLKMYHGMGREISEDQAYEQMLLQREFVSNVGYDTLKQFVSSSEDHKNAVDYLMTNMDALKHYVLGGTPDGSYEASLTVFSDLFKTYKEDLNNKTLTEQKVVLGDLYLRMMVSLSLTHATKVALWTAPKEATNGSTAIDRYRIFKELHQEGKLQNKIFENLCVEEMRFVMNNIIDDEEIKWLNDYTTKKNKYNPYNYIKYTKGYNYWNAKYYSKENYAEWDKKYNLSEFNISNVAGSPKLWMVMEEGAVCGGISKLGSNIRGSFGVPSSVVSQPGHAAYIYYDLDKEGNGTWVLMNDVSGWAKSGKTEKFSIRMFNGWGSGSYASKFPVGYIFLSQAALNEYDAYVEAEEQLMLAKVFKDFPAALPVIYDRALKAEEINFDAWHGLINFYSQDKAKTENDWYALAERIADTLKYYPLPMYDLLRMIEPHLTSKEFKDQYASLLDTSLKAAAAATDKESLQPKAAKQIANYLLSLQK